VRQNLPPYSEADRGRIASDPTDPGRTDTKPDNRLTSVTAGNGMGSP
jgi:hypothetical protein